MYIHSFIYLCIHLYISICFERREGEGERETENTKQKKERQGEIEEARKKEQ